MGYNLFMGVMYVVIYAVPLFILWKKYDMQGWKLLKKSIWVVALSFTVASVVVCFLTATIPGCVGIATCYLVCALSCINQFSDPNSNSNEKAAPEPSLSELGIKT